MRVARVLVPLDGSALAEAILPAARSAGERLGAELVLLHVLERDPPGSVHGERHLCDAAEALAYLDAHAQRLRAAGVAVETHVHERPVDDVAGAIDRHAHEYGADLIAMCAHGRARARRRLLGTIAERILRGGSVPILLRTVCEPGAHPFDARRVLVPLDFEHDVPTALDAACTVARAYGSAVTLLSSVEPSAPPTSRFLPTASAVARDFERDALARRLDELAAPLRAELAEVDTCVADGEPARAILETPADLIVVVTDVHEGLAAVLEPPTARQLLMRDGLTLLLIKEL
jgi:nucleotide-binding universal stress UspA family protein